MAKERERIIALQKQLKIGRDALSRVATGSNRAEWIAQDAIDEMDKIEWASKPNLIQEPVRR